MIMFSKNFVNEINFSDDKDKINKRLKDEKVDILITMCQNDESETIKKKKNTFSKT